jgi:hypothetical protein
MLRKQRNCLKRVKRDAKMKHSWATNQKTGASRMRKSYSELK